MNIKITLNNVIVNVLFQMINRNRYYYPSAGTWAPTLVLANHNLLFWMIGQANNHTDPLIQCHHHAYRPVNILPILEHTHPLIQPITALLTAIQQSHCSSAINSTSTKDQVTCWPCWDMPTPLVNHILSFTSPCLMVQSQCSILVCHQLRLPTFSTAQSKVLMLIVHPNNLWINLNILTLSGFI